MTGYGSGERRGGRQPGSKNKATLERENMISRSSVALTRQRVARPPPLVPRARPSCCRDEAE